MKKERSSALLGFSLTELTRLCMPKCINLKDPQIVAAESQCLRNCVKGLHRTHTQVFSHLMQFEGQQKKDEEKFTRELEDEVNKEEKELKQILKKKAIESEGLVKI